MTKFGTIRYCPDCGSKLKEPSYEGCDGGWFICPNHRFIFIEFSIDDEAVVKQE